MTRNTVNLPASEDRALIELVKRLVRCESHPGVSRQEEAVALELASYLGSRGITPTLTEVEPGRPNLLATIQGPKPGPHLLLCGHTDTVGPYEADAAVLFNPVEREGRLYGRGAVDMKGPLGAMAAALAWLHQGTRLEAGRVSLAAIVDEEMQSLGAEALIRSGFSADAAIVGEPTANHVSIGNKGLEWLRVDFEGRTAHGERPRPALMRSRPPPISFSSSSRSSCRRLPAAVTQSWACPRSTWAQSSVAISPVRLLDTVPSHSIAAG
jgi:acetylornithine deacetylase/succinyl-diaminopimelate desuccinylase-like protein